MSIVSDTNFQKNVFPTVMSCARGLALAHGTNFLIQGIRDLTLSGITHQHASAGASILIGVVLIKLGSKLLFDAKKDFPQLENTIKTAVIGNALLTGFVVPVFINSVTAFLPTVHHQLYFIPAAFLIGLISVEPIKTLNEDLIKHRRQQDDLKFWKRAVGELFKMNLAMFNELRGFGIRRTRSFSNLSITNVPPNTNLTAVDE